MERWVGRVALVTGASSGIGAAICKRLVSAGMVVVGAARNVDKIEALSSELKGKSGTLCGIKCDLTKDADICNLFTEIKKKYKGVDVCVNNAGMSNNNPLLDGTPEEWRNMLEVNVVALCHCFKMAVKSMQERGVNDGHIINLNSIAGHGVPNWPAIHFYAGTKHAVTAITEGMRREVRDADTKIRITSISPGYVDTDFQSKMMGEESAQQLRTALPSVKADDIASSICHVLAAPEHVQIHELTIKPTGETY